MSSTDAIREVFFQECEDLLNIVQEGLTAMAAPNVDPEIIHGVFRAVHSIKGGAGAFGFDQLVRFSHEFEGLLDFVRNGKLETDDDLLAVMWPSYDMLCDQIAAAGSGEEIDPHLTDQLIGKLNDMAPEIAAGPDGSAAEDQIAFEPVAFSFDPGAAAKEENLVPVYRILFRPGPTMYQNGNETSLIFRELAGHGELDAECDTTEIPDFDEIDPEKNYLEWELHLSSDASEQTVRSVFEFVENDCTLEITRTEPDIGPSGDSDIADMADLTDSKFSARTAAGGNSIDTFASEHIDASNSDPDSVANKYDRSPVSQEVGDPVKSATSIGSTIRVEVTRVDRLINLMGELVINQAMLSQCVIDSDLPPDSGFVTGLDELGRLTRDAQDSIMAIRAQPLKSLFQRMARTVREAAAATGKTVRFKTSGELTEVDKTIIEKLADPLTHMIRNAVDHGLESDETRAASGKPAEGTVWLAAAHRSGRVLIDVIDDGAGIDREAVRQTAIQKGLIGADEKLSPEDTDALLFLPGFSTAREVSNLSGRGVGMDVVRNSIATLGGRVTISSRPGRGSTFSISLPLTLAVLDGMVVDVAKQRMVIPIGIIVETLRPNKKDVHHIGSSRVIFVRNEYMPVIDVGHVLGYRDKLSVLENTVFILIETDDGFRFALIVDGIQDQRQVVIKGLDENYGDVSGIAAATILGDGQVALILDPNDPLFGGRPAVRELVPALAKIG